MTVPSIAATAGRALLLKIASATSPTNYITVAGLRATQVALNGNPVDITTKSSLGWQELLAGAGITSVDITGSGVLDASNTQLVALRDAIMTSPTAPVVINAQIVTSLGTFTGKFVVRTFQLDGNHNDAQTYTLSVGSDGPITAA